jgi:hypothetical protein
VIAAAAGRTLEPDVPHGRCMARPIRRRPLSRQEQHMDARFYQEIAVQRVLEAIADDRDRILLTLATGTGKTSIAFQIAWKLFQARWNLTDWKTGASPTRRLLRSRASCDKGSDRRPRRGPSLRRRSW